MSEYIGGHELDAPNTRSLFNIVWGLGAVTLLAIATCVQLFNHQRDALVEEQEVSYRLQEYRQDMAQKTQKAGETEIKTPDGKTLEVLKYIPLNQAKVQVLRNPQMALKAASPPQGWMHPDDIASGTQTATGLQTKPGEESVDSVLVSPPLDSQQEPHPEIHPAHSPEPSPQEKPALDNENPDAPDADVKKENENPEADVKVEAKKPEKKPSKKKPVEETKAIEQPSSPVEPSKEPSIDQPEPEQPAEPVVPKEEPAKSEPADENPVVKETPEL